MTNAVHVYLIQPKRPWLASEPYLADLKATKKGVVTWALPHRLGGRKFKLGSSVFLTQEAAEKRRQGLCAALLQKPKVALYTRLGISSVCEAAARIHPPKLYSNQIPT
jgi:hypothetical protein